MRALVEDAPPWVQNVAQLLSLLWCMWFHFARGALGAWVSLAHPLTWLGERHEGVEFVVGRVHHARDHPVRRSFSYPLRLAVVDLDAPPAWFARSGQAADHLTADQARARAGADGPVLLLTSPWTFGYVQNPISVYYVYDACTNTKDDELGVSGAYRLRACAAEVTNTPWGERVVFDFDPSGQRVPKSLHVSPFMDALGDWHVKATDPMACGLFREKSREWEHEHEGKGQTHAKSRLAVHVDVVGHPAFGDYFRASFVGRLDAPRRRRARNERAGLATLWRHACTPHRVAFWIYAQAARVLWAGVPFVPPPGLGAVAEKSRARDAELGDARRRGRARGGEPADAAAARPAGPGGGCPLRLTWREAGGWPWKT
jgi:DUF1365 family protein